MNMFRKKMEKNQYVCEKKNNKVVRKHDTGNNAV